MKIWHSDYKGRDNRRLNHTERGVSIAILVLAMKWILGFIATVVSIGGFLLYMLSY